MAKVEIVDRWHDLREIETPHPTETWTPVGHYSLIEIVEKEIKGLDLKVVNRRLELNRNYNQLFFSYTLENPRKRARAQFAIGGRNSLDKSLAIAFCSGLNIVVCSNMQFDGEWMTFRKHSGNLTLEEVASLTSTAIGYLPSTQRDFEQRLNRYTSVLLNENAFKALIWDMMVDQVIPSNRFKQYLKCLEEEKRVKANKGLTLATIYQAATRLYRDQSLVNISSFTPTLMNYCDQLVTV